MEAILLLWLTETLMPAAMEPQIMKSPPFRNKKQAKLEDRMWTIDVRIPTVLLRMARMPPRQKQQQQRRPRQRGRGRGAGVDGEATKTSGGTSAEDVIKTWVELQLQREQRRKKDKERVNWLAEIRRDLAARVLQRGWRAYKVGVWWCGTVCVWGGGGVLFRGVVNYAVRFKSTSGCFLCCTGPMPEQSVYFSRVTVSLKGKQTSSIPEAGMGCSNQFEVTLWYIHSYFVIIYPQQLQTSLSISASSPV